jgi:hypothetical protein
MSQQANLKSLKIDGVTYSPSGEWTLQFGGKSIESTMNLDNTTSEKEIPELDVASGPIRVAKAKDLQTLVGKKDITLVAVLRNGDIYQCSGGRVTNHPEINTDGGEVEIEFSGKGRFI